jgi:hypothetical protein
MGAIQFGGAIIHGNFERVRRYKTKDGRPRKWWDRDYKAVVPYPFKWRSKLGKVECDCKEIIESYQPYYGFTYTHEDNCATMHHLRRYPQMENFMYDNDPRVIAQSC